MNSHVTAARRRGRLKRLLQANTQAQAQPTQRELLTLLGESVSLRTLKRDMRVLRGRVTKGTHSTRDTSVNRSQVGSNRAVTKKLNTAQRLRALEAQRAHDSAHLEQITEILRRLVAVFENHEARLRRLETEQLRDRELILESRQPQQCAALEQDDDEAHASH